MWYLWRSWIRGLFQQRRGSRVTETEWWLRRLTWSPSSALVTFQPKVQGRDRTACADDSSRAFVLPLAPSQRALCCFTLSFFRWYDLNHSVMISSSWSLSTLVWSSLILMTPQTATLGTVPYHLFSSQTISALPQSLQPHLSLGKVHLSCHHSVTQEAISCQQF